MPRYNKYNQEEEVDQLSIDTYMTVLWPKTRHENLYINDFLELCNRVLNFDLTTITEKEYDKIKDEYTSYFKNINRFAECINILLSGRLYQKYKLYKNSFLDKIEQLYKHMLTQNINLEQNAFLEFMYQFTVEGRIVMQNSLAIKQLETIEAARDHLALINSMLHPIIVKKEIEADLPNNNVVSLD